MDGPPLYLYQVFKNNGVELGVDKTEIYVPVENDNPKGHPSTWGKVDLYIWVDFGEDGLPVKYIPCPKPNVYWCSDSHLGLEYRLNKAKEFDYVFVSIREHIDKFKKAVGHDRVYWLPHAGEPTCYTKKEVIKRYDICFIGHLPTQERIELLDRLFKEFPEFYFGQKFFEATSYVYNQSKLVFNHCISKEANMRVFESTLSGSAVLNNYSEDVESLGYKDGENIIFYNNPDEMIEKAKYYIEHDDEREAIAKKGLEHTLANHTYKHRAIKIMDIINNKGG